MLPTAYRKLLAITLETKELKSILVLVLMYSDITQLWI